MAFWKKIFKSKYTGAEIDAAVAKAGTVPTVTSADEGKALVVDSEGKIVPGEAGANIEFNKIRSADKIALKIINAGDDDYIPGCTDVVYDEYVASIINKTLGPYTKNPSANFNTTVAGGNEAVRYDFPYIELQYTPTLATIQTLLTTGTATEICAGLIFTGSHINHYAAVLINLAGEVYTLNYAGSSGGIDTYKGYFAVKEDAQLGTGIAIVKLNIQSVNDSTTLITYYDFIAIS